MAIIKQGILGGFSGKIGNIVGGNWKGIDYMRVLTKPTNPNSEKQVKQRTKFTTALSFLQPITPFLRVGYKLHTAKQTAFNAAMSQVLTNAVTGENENIAVDYTKAQISAGTLTPAFNAAFTHDNGEIKITWDDNSGTGTAKATDKSMYVVHNPAKNDAVFDTSAAIRSAKNQTIDLPPDWINDTVHVYLSFISTDGTDVSNSTYLGSVKITTA